MQRQNRNLDTKPPPPTTSTAQKKAGRAHTLTLRSPELALARQSAGHPAISAEITPYLFPFPIGTFPTFTLPFETSLSRCNTAYLVKCGTREFFLMLSLSDFRFPTSQGQEREPVGAGQEDGNDLPF